MQVVAVLFVCLGNICRSPLAEGALRGEAERLGLDVAVDSAGTGHWHVGAPPDCRAIEVAQRHGVDISGLRARQVCKGDFNRFDRIVALDPDNLRVLRAMAPANAKARLSLLLDHVPGRSGAGVADPYHGEADHFERTWADVCEGTAALAAELQRT